MNKTVELGLGAGVGALASELLKLLIAEAKMVLTFKSVYNDLASKMEELRPTIEEIEKLQKVEELKNLKDTIIKARVLVEKCSRVQRWNCFLKSYYNRKIVGINKKMKNFCQVQMQILQFRNQLQIDKNIDLLIAPGPHVYRDLCSVAKLDIVPVGLDWPLMELKKRLLDDSVVSLLVSAPPGCGKTTLVTQLYHDQDIRGKFKHIFFNVVSSTPNFRGIVQDLFQHNGYQALTFQNDAQALDGLKKLLEKLKEDGQILLVLDDVWPGGESLLEKFRGYKILVTSRYDFPSFDFTYHLQPLKDKDARSLLIKWALPPHHTVTDEYEHLFEKILKRCNGFPLVIEVVGASLKGQALHLWKGQVESWSAEETILSNPRPKVLQCLQPSFNALKPYLKECFMDMGSFREDQKIRASVIVDIWVELYGKGSSLLYMKYLNDLASQNLLKLIPLGSNEHKDGFYNELLVTQHDLLRELAINQSESGEFLERKKVNLVIRGDNYPKWCLNLKQAINACLLSISTDDSFSSSWVEMDCPNVEALVLNLSSSNYALPDFIATMKKLKVVTIINDGLKPAKLTNLSCLSLLPNVKRIRLEKVSVTLSDILQLLLDGLKKLSLVMCSFNESSNDTKEIDVSKALSSLQEIDIDYCYDLDELPYWISEAVSLQTLSITNCNKLSKLPEAIGNLSKLEVLRLSSCINLSELPETTERLRNLQFLDISDCLELKKLPLEIGKLQKLKKISMRKCGRCILPDSVKYLENLEVKCDEETGILWRRFKPVMKNLIVHEEETEHNLNLLQIF
ncbi:hypothetical protein EUTSA_v10020099mg [Eutrema salsugineum]|uniref:RPW8 domain-containing protein n=1 Tax=Eutrema salsugineum TaxID=72664 RepID=V4LUE4_EUTSA|nr:probable disease resistance protein At5g66900 [Eutrema salsugineum]ESQ47459.1 hypothetical protein EUTSA_v10020099mg [Eutrema salsugineum]